MAKSKNTEKEKKSVAIPEVLETQEQADAFANTHILNEGATVFVTSDKQCFDSEHYARKYASRKKKEVFKCKIS